MLHQESKYKANNAPTREEFPAFKKTEVEKNDEVHIQLESEKSEQDHNGSSEKKIDEDHTEIEAKITEQGHVHSLRCFKIVEHSQHISSYKYQMARELSDEEILDLTRPDEFATSDSNSDNDIADTADSLETFKSEINVPDVIIKGRKRIYLVILRLILLLCSLLLIYGVYAFEEYFDASNELDVVSPVSVSVVNEVDTRDEDTSDVVVPDVESGGSVGRSRPRRNARIPVRYRT
ncbi:hypothetical protein SSX86_006976 [Deinandra increscens subsp. villosa]|uniref:Uncharacterized protein n=1 Tax=Deinandra increscens subsp. villosa TaxID=3103831 RepID=A0AAP0DNU3_9ASTR